MGLGVYKGACSLQAGAHSGGLQTVPPPPAHWTHHPSGIVSNLKGQQQESETLDTVHPRPLLPNRRASLGRHPPPHNNGIFQRLFSQWPHHLQGAFKANFLFAFYDSVRPACVMRVPFTGAKLNTNASGVGTGPLSPDGPRPGLWTRSPVLILLRHPHALPSLQPSAGGLVS